MKRWLMVVAVASLVVAVSGNAAASLVLQLDGIEIFAFDGNYYTYYGTNDSFTSDPYPMPVGFGIEVQGTSSIIVSGDPEHYGLVVSGDYGDELLGTTTYNAPFEAGVPDATVADITTGPGFSDDNGTREWALSYSHDGLDPIPNPYHSVLFGDLPDLFSDPSQFAGLTGPGNELFFRDDLGNDGPGGIYDRLDLTLTLDSDGIYHSVHAQSDPATNPEVSLTDMSDYLNDFTLNGNGGPGVLTLTGSVYEIGFDAYGRNVWSTQNPVPEPMSMVMLGCIGVGMFSARKIRWKKINSV